MKSEIIKLKDGPFDDAGQQIEKLIGIGWECDVLRNDEIYSHGNKSCDFKHTYIWTVLCKME